MPSFVREVRQLISSRCWLCNFKAREQASGTDWRYLAFEFLGHPSLSPLCLLGRLPKMSQVAAVTVGRRHRTSSGPTAVDTGTDSTKVTKSDLGYWCRPKNLSINFISCRARHFASGRMFDSLALVLRGDSDGASRHFVLEYVRETKISSLKKGNSNNIT